MATGGGTTNKTKTIIELIRYCRRLGRWEELQYLKLFLNVENVREELERERELEAVGFSSLETLEPLPHLPSQL